MAQRPYAYLVPATITGWALALASLGQRALSQQLGANPIATALNQLGLLALVLLMASLCCTPLKLAFGLTWPMRVRRTLGLLAFFTALLHFLVYLGADLGFQLSAVVSDVVKRPFIAVGSFALLLLLPLAWTSSKQAVQRLGFAVWQRLHRLVYVAAALALLHFYMRVKADATLPLVYAALLAGLFGVRIAAFVMKARAAKWRSRAH